MAVGVKELATRHAIKTVPNPCYGCGERFPGCYSGCERRQEYLRRFEEERAGYTAQYKKNNDARDYLMVSSAKKKKRRKD